MVVYFLRHAEAEADADNDYDRKLTAKGLQQAEKAGKFFVRNGFALDLILTSPVVRARQTAKVVAENLEAELVEETWLACGMAPETCLRRLRDLKGKNSLLLVGHEPDFSQTIARMLGMADPDAFTVRKASLTAIALRDFQPGKGELQFFVPVRLM